MVKNELILIKPTRHKDERGFFSETYSRRRYKEVGIDVDFVQDNHSFSREPGTLRGLHFQAPPNAQGKLVRCSKGAIFDVTVDIRKGSPRYGDWAGYELTEGNAHQLYVPVGFAHGFVTLHLDLKLCISAQIIMRLKQKGLLDGMIQISVLIGH